MAWQLTPEYRCWSGIKTRCYNRNRDEYQIYGARGIGMCDRWRYSFDSFLADMGHKPSPQHSIERIDSDGDYEPGNCRWATNSEQQRNKRTNRVLEFRGVRLCLTDMAAKYGLSRDLLKARLKLGWSLERSLLQPVDSKHENSPLSKWIEFRGERDSITGMARRYGLSQPCLSGRLIKGWSIERALLTPTAKTARARESTGR